MTALVSVADGLNPQPDYGFLLPGVVAWGGYVGKPSVGAWTHGQVAALERTGRLWLPIWSAGNGSVYTHAEAIADAASMLAGLHALGIDDGRWVFLDIEYARWVNTPGETESAAAYWCSLMRASGWPRAGWYGPAASTATWRARWNGIPPTTLPPGVIGIQYDHGLAGDRYDISRFDPSILEVTDMPTAQEIAQAIMAENVTPQFPGGVPLPYGVRVADIDNQIQKTAILLGQLVDLQTRTLAAVEALAPPPGP